MTIRDLANAFDPNWTGSPPQGSGTDLNYDKMLLGLGESGNYPTFEDLMTPNLEYNGMNYWKGYECWQEGLDDKDPYKRPGDTSIDPKLLEFLLQQVTKNN